MALEIIKAYTAILSQFFTLSDVAIAESSIKKEGEDPPIPPFVPEGTTVIASCHYGEKVVEEVNDCAGDLMAVDVSGEAAASLKGLLDSLRWRFEEVVAATWARGMSCKPVKSWLQLMTDSRMLHNLEDWHQTSAKGPSKYLGLMDAFQNRILASCKKIATRSGEKDTLPSNFKRMIKENFVDTTCFLFDGILNSTTLHTDPGPRRMSRLSSSRILTVNDIVSTRTLHD